MSAGFSNWLAHIKSDDNDIDNGLANDFDGSLSGLGVDVGSSTYNMSEALQALPAVFKQETRSKSDTKLAVGLITSLSSSLDFSQLGFSSARAQGVRGLSGGSPPLTGIQGSLTGGASPLYQTVTVSDLTGSHSLSLPDLPGAMDQMNHEWVNLMTSMNLGGETEDSSEGRFQYILCAPTSPATRISEETLTYLNQGQSYEIKLKRLKLSGNPDELLLKSVVRVVFHERRLQYMEKEQLDLWKMTRPGERIVDIDIPQSNLLLDVRITPHRLNCVEFVWDPSRDTSVFIKVHCISTEFTAKKHGGEKGVPFRIQVETYSHSGGGAGGGVDGDGEGEGEEGGGEEDSVPILLHCASCQVKVFKPKGADRKLKTDREKVEKLVSDVEKGKYQPSYECTVLIEIPLDQVRKYLELLHKQMDDDEKRGKETVPINSIPSGKSISGKSDTSFSGYEKSTVSFSESPTEISLENPSGGNFDFSFVVGNEVYRPGMAPSSERVRQSSGALGGNLKGSCKQLIAPAASPSPSSASSSSGNGSVAGSAAVATTVTSPLATSSSFVAQSRKRPSETCLAFRINHSSLRAGYPYEENTLTHGASDDDVAHWLTVNRFSNFVNTFKNFAGSDLLRLHRDDLIQICGLADGIRLFNSLQAKTVRPKLTLYVCQATDNDSYNPAVGRFNIASSANQSHMTVPGHASPTDSTNSRTSTPSPTLTAYSTGHTPDHATVLSSPNLSPHTPSPYSSPTGALEPNSALQNWSNQQRIQQQLISQQQLGQQPIGSQQQLISPLLQQQLEQQRMQQLTQQRLQQAQSQQLRQQLLQGQQQQQVRMSQPGQAGQGQAGARAAGPPKSSSVLYSIVSGDWSVLEGNPPVKGAGNPNWQQLQQRQHQMGSNYGVWSQQPTTQQLIGQSPQAHQFSTAAVSSPVATPSPSAPQLTPGSATVPRQTAAAGLAAAVVSRSAATVGGGAAAAVRPAAAVGGGATQLSVKRQIYESDDNDDDDVCALSGFKKQRMIEQWKQEVYHALYLDSMSERHLAEKLSHLYSISTNQILDILVHGPLGIHILVTDTVVQNFKDQSKYSVRTTQDDIRDKCSTKSTLPGYSMQTGLDTIM